MPPILIPEQYYEKRYKRVFAHLSNNPPYVFVVKQSGYPPNGWKGLRIYIKLPA
jgi:hypothetical protein